MIYIVHGEDLSKSRILVLNQQKKLNVEKRIELDITNTTPEEIFEKSHSNDLFGNPPFIVLDITSAGRLNVDSFVQVLERVPNTTTLIVLSGKSLSNTNPFIKNASKLKAKTNINELVPQANVFRLIDAIFYRQREKSYLELSKLLLESVSPFEIFSLVSYGLRTVSSAKFNSSSFKKLHDFVKRKSQSQANLFTTHQLINIFEEIRKLDIKSKMGEIDEELLIPMTIEMVLNS